jgi:hypothetical protein
MVTATLTVDQENVEKRHGTNTICDVHVINLLPFIASGVGLLIAH